MTIKRLVPALRSTKTRALGLIAALLTLGLLTSACGGAAAPAASAAAVTAVPAAPGQATTAVPVAAGGKTNPSLNCPALQQALLDLIGANSGLMLLTNGNGSVTNQLDSPFYIDTAKMRADLDLFATLPDPTDATEIAIMGKPSESIAQYRQLLDLVDRSARAGGTPDTTTGADDGQQLVAFTAKMVKMYTGIANALGHACPDQPTPAAQAAQPAPQATALTARYQIGQAAPVGNLLVTLDKVVTVPGADPLQPAPDSHLVIAYFTVENNGTVPFGVNPLLNTRFEDARAKQYPPDPFVASLEPQSTNFDGKVAPGEKRSGAAVYQVPIAGGDLVWLFEDARPNIAVYAVAAAAVLVVGTPNTEPTQAALQADAAATQTAFMGMMVDAAATEDAAGTATPAPPEPTSPPEPIDETATPVPSP